jgi:predicted dehydrogenase
VSKLRAAVVGVGYLGKFHAQKYRALDGVDLVGVCDRDAAAGRAVAQSLSTEYFADHRDLVGKVDAVTVAASTSAHFELTKFFLDNGVHVLVEKPMTRTSREAAVLTELAQRRNLKLQVGHVERFNPALLSAREGLTGVRFIECHRLAQFKGRGADVNVILDLMIHDLDVILSLVDAKPTAVSAVGIPVLTDDFDIANARIEFANQAIANVTASRASTSAQRKFRVWQPNQYVSIDFGGGEVRRVTRRGDPRAGAAALEEESWSLEKGDALLAETKSFVAAITADTPCEVSGADGVAALELAEKIVAEIERRARWSPS